MKLITNRKIKEVRLNVRIAEDLRQKYKKYCLDNKLDMSKHLREYIEQVLEIDEM